jgi:ABC-type nitrate/sulfonate/bicarbonate transport system substrate-binding protein
MSGRDRLRIGYIPLVDAAALVVAVDKGFAAAEGLDIELVREVSWSNVRDKLNIGLFDAAHMLSPVAVASSLGIGHVRVPLIAPFNIGFNGNAITVSPSLFIALTDAADGDIGNPLVSARALGRLVAARRSRGQEPLTFGMTFPFSNHNYQLRFWMAAGGIDPDEDVRLVVLPPPYMVESLTSGHVDGFCVGAPWNSVAVDLGIGNILHFGSDIFANISEKVLAVRRNWADEHPAVLARLIRAMERAAQYVAEPMHRAEIVRLLASAERIAVSEKIIEATMAGNLKTSPSGTTRASERYLVIGGATSRPDPVQGMWIYTQMVRWRQAPLSSDSVAAARSVYRPDLYDAALGSKKGLPLEERDRVEPFAGPEFNPADIPGYLAAWIGRPV